MNNMNTQKALDVVKEYDDPISRLARMILWVAPNPNSVLFHLTEGHSKLYIEVDIPKGERGKIIGRDGVMIQAIRTLFFASLKSDDPRYDISLVEDPKVQTGERGLE